MSLDAKPTAVRNLRAPTADALARIATDYDLAPETRAYLVAKVEQSGFAGVIVDAHEIRHEGATHFHASITKLFSFLLAFSLQLSALAAITSSNLVTYADTGGASTNTGQAVLIGTAYIASAPSYIISDGGTTSTNALTVEIQYGLDTTNFSTQAIYTKAATNATEGVVTPGILAVRIYARTRVVTTNAVPVGTKAVFTTTGP